MHFGQNSMSIFTKFYKNNCGGYNWFMFLQILLTIEFKNENFEIFK